jgi:hypothetical protein
MFEAIENLLTIVIWGAAILLFVGGVIVCIVKLVKGGIGSKSIAVVAAILGIVAFVKMYDWTEHIAWCMLASGFILCLFTGVLSDGEKNTLPKEPKYGLGDAILETYAEYELTKAAVKDAIEESRK